jgi:dethiobiotin synthetase
LSLGRLIVVSGTGTGIGKTHASEALLIALSEFCPKVAGLKPIETGMGEATISDAARLERVSSFHVKPFGYVFAEPLSPHLAARDANTPIELDVLVPLVEAARATVDALLIELPGGLFTPLSDSTFNADFVRAMSPDTTLLVAQDRIGVLHEVISTRRAASTAEVEIDGILLVAPEQADLSTGLNAAELERLLDVAVVARLGRGRPRDLAAEPEMRALADRLSREWLP